MSLKTLIVGWDGATYDVIKPLVDSGRMPVMAGLMKSGVWGPLSSTVPPLTPVAWTSIITGVNPGKHGIYDGIVFDRQARRFRFVNATTRRVKPIWSVLSERGKTVGALNVPVTYPPDQVNGFTIPGMLTPFGAPDFMHPSSLKDDIEAKLGPYMIECNQLEDPAQYLDLIIEMIDARERVALYLMDRYPLDFFFTVFMATDRVQHFFWKYLDPAHPDHAKYGGSVAKVYERLDISLGRLIEKAGRCANLLMVSDHGAGPLKTAFVLNNWLISKGYLHLKADPSTVMKARKPSWLKSEIARSVKKVLPEFILDKVRKGTPGQEELSVFLSLIDWEKTKIFSDGLAGSIYINNDAVSLQERDNVARTLSRELLEVVDGNGKKVIQSVHRKEDIYAGDAMENAPDLVAICAPGFHIISPNEFMFFNQDYNDKLFLPHKWSGRHEEYGIFLAWGPGVRNGVRLEGTRIIDVAPTAIYLMGEAVPEYMDGHVLENAITPEHLAGNKVRYTGDSMAQEHQGKNLSEDEQREIAKRLRGLGYME